MLRKRDSKHPWNADREARLYDSGISHAADLTVANELLQTNPNDS